MERDDGMIFVFILSILFYFIFNLLLNNSRKKEVNSIGQMWFLHLPISLSVSYQLVIYQSVWKR